MNRSLMVALAFLPLFSLGIGNDARGFQEGDGKRVIIDDDEPGGYLGVSVEDLSSQLADSLKTSTRSGAVVAHVVAQSPAEKAGLQRNDIIVAFNGKQIDDRWDLLKEVRRANPGSTVTMNIIRNGSTKTITATLGEEARRERHGTVLPDPPVPPRFVFPGFGSYGLTLMELHDQLAEFFGAPDGHGVLVEEVERESPAATAGFKAGDVIIQAGKETVEDPHDVWSAMDRATENEKVDMQVIRKGARVTLSLKAQPDEHSSFRPPRFPRHWDVLPPDFDRKMEELGTRLGKMGKELERKMKGLEQRIREELRVIKV